MAKILVIDDDEQMRVMLEEMLKRANHEVVLACDGNEGMALYKESPTDVIITDLVMPNKNGIDLILDMQIQFPDAKVIAISGGGGVAGRFDYLAVSKMLNAGPILKKPFTWKELQDAVDEVLGIS